MYTNENQMGKGQVVIPMYTPTRFILPTSHYDKTLADRAVNFINDHAGQSLNYTAVSEAVRTVRACRPLARDWKQDIEADYKARK